MKERKFKIGDIVQHVTDSRGLPNKMLVVGIGIMTISEGTQNICALSRISMDGQIYHTYTCEDELCLYEELKR